LAYETSGVEAAYLRRYGTDAGIYEHKGLVTGTKVAQLHPDGTIGASYLYTCLYYDIRKRLIQSVSTNHLDGIEKEYIAYNFIDQPVKKTHVHTKNGSGGGRQTEVYAYIYDHAGRLLKITHQLNGGMIVTLAENTYDELGRLKTNKKGGVVNTVTTYTYNVRSWIKSVSSALFSQTLYYNESYGGSAKQYNGNISAMSWKQSSEVNYNGYAFTYDGLSRLTAANYLVNGVSSTHFRTAYMYDKHGNMTSLQRYGKKDVGTGTSSYGPVDDLTMTYVGNQLTQVDDAVGTISFAQSMDFKNYSNAAMEYTYNANGAMTKDLNKGISDIRYNSLNLPRRMDIKSPVAEARNEYTYSASGTKLKVLQKWNPSYSTIPVIGSVINTAALSMSKTTDYVGNFIYENNVLKRILINGGYIENGVYHYYLTDHQGNNRIVVNASGVIVQRNNYYPFGATFGDNTVAEQGKQPYKYNSKELDQMHGLNWYDYSARWKDDWRFMTVDPLAEKYYSTSPYAYCLNNSLRYTDPGGDSVRVYTETQATGHTWISVGEGDDLVVYSYGRYNGTNKGPDGSSNSLANGPGVLLRLTGEEAKAYNEEKAAGGMSVFVVADIADETIVTAMDEKFNSSTITPNKGKYQDASSAHVVDEYSLINNNCTTVVSDVLNSSGSKVLTGMMYLQTSTFGTWTTVPVQHRFVIPASMQNYLIKMSKPGGTTYRTR